MTEADGVADKFRADDLESIGSVKAVVKSFAEIIHRHFSKKVLVSRILKRPIALGVRHDNSQPAPDAQNAMQLPDDPGDALQMLQYIIHKDFVGEIRFERVGECIEVKMFVGFYHGEKVTIDVSIEVLLPAPEVNFDAHNRRGTFAPFSAFWQRDSRIVRR